MNNQPAFLTLGVAIACPLASADFRVEPRSLTTGGRLPGGQPADPQPGQVAGAALDSTFQPQ